MPFRFWEMALGSLTYLLVSKNYNFLKYLENLPPSLISLLMITILFFNRSNIVLSTVLINFLTCLLIINLYKQSRTKNFFKNKVILYIGSISYSLYLWHWSILSIARWTIGVNKITILPLVLTILIVSHFSFKYIENTFRYSLNKRNLNIILINFGPNFINSLIFMKKPGLNLNLSFHDCLQLQIRIRF